MAEAMVADTGVEQLVAAIQRDVDLASLKLGEEFFYASLPLAVIDAVFSIGVTYESTSRTVRRWCEAQNPPWARRRSDSSEEHTLSAFIAIARSMPFDDLAAKVFENRQRTSSRSGILKAEAAIVFAEALVRQDIERFADMQDTARVARAYTDILAIPGQRSGISWDYFLMLAGSDDYIKADRMVCRYVGRAIGLSQPATPQVAKALLLDAAAMLKTSHPAVTPRALDYAIWSLQRDAA